MLCSLPSSSSSAPLTSLSRRRAGGSAALFFISHAGCGALQGGWGHVALRRLPSCSSDLTHLISIVMMMTEPACCMCYSQFNCLLKHHKAHPGKLYQQHSHLCICLFRTQNAAWQQRAFRASRWSLSFDFIKACSKCSSQKLKLSVFVFFCCWILLFSHLSSCTPVSVLVKASLWGSWMALPFRNNYTVKKLPFLKEVWLRTLSRFFAHMSSFRLLWGVFLEKTL